MLHEFRHSAVKQCLVGLVTDKPIGSQMMIALELADGLLCCGAKIAIDADIITGAGKCLLDFTDFLSCVAETEGCGIADGRDGQTECGG